MLLFGDKYKSKGNGTQILMKKTEKFGFFPVSFERIVKEEAFDKGFEELSKMPGWKIDWIHDPPINSEESFIKYMLREKDHDLERKAFVRFVNVAHQIGDISKIETMVKKIRTENITWERFNTFVLYNEK